MLYLVNNVFIMGNVIHMTDIVGGFNYSKDRVFSNYSQASTSADYWQERLQLSILCLHQSAVTQ